jgi:hypothetical protein
MEAVEAEVTGPNGTGIMPGPQRGPGQGPDLVSVAEVVKRAGVRSALTGMGEWTGKV